MIEYAIVPPLIAIVSWSLLYIYQLKNKWSFIVIITSFALVIVTMLLIYFLEVLNTTKNVRIENINKDWRSFFTKEIVLTFISIFSIVSIAVFSFFIFKYFKTKKEIYYLLTFIFATICIIIIIFRWLWGPIAFINYYNRFITVKTNKGREISGYFYFYLTPIILKGLITIPIYTTILTLLVPILLKLKKKYDQPKY
ncbi:hypothetical protein ACR34G_02755 [Mycoplasma sp. 480]|uniref:hypothetical protein n=1 Tax=Mycoplasma sp. 480 TaxID=3440155 RepID=UPI003F516C97